MSTVTALLLAACTSLALTAGPAAAHTGIVDSSPADGASVQQAPEQVRLRFVQPVDPELVALVVTGPDGRERSAGPPSVTGAEVVQPLIPAAGGGTYRVAYRVVSTDGHPVQGQVGFGVAAPGRAVRARSDDPGQVVVMTSAPAAAEDSGGPGSPLLAVVAALVVATVPLVLRRHRARRTRGADRA